MGHTKHAKQATKKDTSAKVRVKTSMVGNGQLEEFFHDLLKDIYSAENNLLKTLPAMQKAASSELLNETIGKHIEETKEHIQRLEKVFKMMGKKPEEQKCEAMAGLLKEANIIIQETDEGSMTRDVGIITAVQKIEHYEIATYGSMVQLASILGHDDISHILHDTLVEEKNVDIRLTEVAENNVNEQAEEEGPRKENVKNK